MSAISTEKSFRITGWHVLAAVVAFFGVVIVVDGVFLVTAYRTFPGQVSVTPYEDGLAYNSRMARQRAQAALGWRAEVTTVAAGVSVAVLDAEGLPVRGLSVSGGLSRPATEAGRLSLTFAETAPGRYEAKATPAGGGWDLSVLARSEDGAVFEAERRLTWP